MNRNLSIEKYTGAILEALEPRMQGEDLGSLEEFKKVRREMKRKNKSVVCLLDLEVYHPRINTDDFVCSKLFLHTQKILSAQSTS